MRRSDVLRFVLLFSVGCSSHGVDSSALSALSEDPGGPPPPELAPGGVGCWSGQIYGTAQHAGTRCEQLPAMEVIDQVVQDPWTQQENDDLGFVGVHYGTTLTSSDGMVFVPTKTGYTTIFDKGTQTWGVRAMRWSGGKLRTAWEFESSWKPFDSINPFGTTNGYESLFQPALTSRTIDVPMDAGRIARLDRASGRVLAFVNPLAGTPYDGDSSTIVNSALTVGPDDNVYYTVVAWDPSGSPSVEPRESWLVRITPLNLATIVPWTQVTALPGITGAQDQCYYTFRNASPVPPRPWPPSPTTLPPQFRCGKQRPPINGAPAVTQDGRVVVMTSNNNAIVYAHLVAYDFATASPVWQATLRAQISDGCGVKIPLNDPSNSEPSYCRFGALQGVDPTTNQPVAGRLPSIFKSSPVVAPDGSIFVSSYSGSYDNNQGHLHHFSSTGAPLGVLDYGFDQTPAIRRTGLAPSDYELVMDYNAFSPLTGDGTGPGLDASVARVSPSLVVLSRGRVPLDPAAYSNDFADPQIALDSQGNAYALSSSGRVVKFAPDGTRLDEVRLPAPSYSTLGTAMSWGVDQLGRPALYVGYGGSVYVIGSGDGGTPLVADGQCHTSDGRFATCDGRSVDGESSVRRGVILDSSRPPSNGCNAAVGDDTDLRNMGCTIVGGTTQCCLDWGDGTFTCSTCYGGQCTYWDCYWYTHGGWSCSDFVNSPDPTAAQ